MRTLARAAAARCVGLDIVAGAVHRSQVGSIADRAFVDAAACRASRPCCTPRPCTSRMSRPIARQDFVDTNITGTLNLLEEAVARGRRAPSSSPARPASSAMRSCRRRARRPPGSPRRWRRSRRTSTASPRPPPRISASSSTRNAGACRASCCRTSRFFPEEDDNQAVRERLCRRELIENFIRSK